MLYPVRMKPVAPRSCLALLLVAPAMLTSCRVGGASSEADALREKVVGLEKDLSKARAERDEARAVLAEAERVRLAGSGDLPAEVLAAVPRCATVTLDRGSGLSRDGAWIDVTVKPADARGRFVQIVGTLSVRADYIPPPEADSAGRAQGAAPAEPRPLGAVTLSPGDLRDAYRSSLMGTHYVARIPVPPGALEGPGAERGSIALSLEFLDALSGQAHRDSLTTRVR